MNRRSRILWILSTLLLGWMAALGVITTKQAGCAANGEVFSVRQWTCTPASPRLILKRDLERG